MINEEYFKVTTPALLTKLSAETQPLWGRLTPQHMVEHLVSTWRIGNGKSSAPLLISPEEEVKRKAYLESDIPFSKNIPNALMGDGLPELRKPNLQAAIDQLLLEIDDFFSYYESNPEAVFIHPFFGELNKREWLLFHQKHLTHHFTQFGLQ